MFTEILAAAATEYAGMPTFQCRKVLRSAPASRQILAPAVYWLANGDNILIMSVSNRSVTEHDKTEPCHNLRKKNFDRLNRLDMGSTQQFPRHGLHQRHVEEAQVDHPVLTSDPDMHPEPKANMLEYLTITTLSLHASMQQPLSLSGRRLLLHRCWPAATQDCHGFLRPASDSRQVPGA